MIIQTAKILLSSRLTLPTSSIDPVSHLYARLRSYSNFSHPLIQQSKYIPVIFSTASYRTCIPPSKAVGPSKKHRLTYKPYIKKIILPHDEKNMKLHRPMSPHLTIYGPTLPAMTSIAQRATGSMMTAYALTMASVALFVPRGVTGMVEYIQSWDLPEFLIIGIKIVIATSFAFHYFIGIRFVGFNLGKLLDLKTAYTSAYISLILALAGGVAGGLIGHAYSFQ